MPHPARTAYSRAELASDAAVHVAGVAFTAVAAPALILFALRRGASTAELLAVSIYCVTLLAMLGCSALYNTLGRRRWHGLLRRLALGLYLAMGWAGVAAGGVLLGHLSGPVIALIGAGGVLYTAGVAFYLLERMPFHYTLWHVFVLVASVMFYVAVTLHVAQTTLQVA